MEAILDCPILVEDTIVYIARILIESLLSFDIEPNQIDTVMYTCYFVFQRVSKTFATVLKRDIPACTSIPWFSLRWYCSYHIAAASYRIGVKVTSPIMQLGDWQRQCAELFQKNHTLLGGVLRLATYRRNGFTTFTMRLIVEILRETSRIPICYITVTGRTREFVRKYFAEHLDRLQSQPLSIGIVSNYYDKKESAQPLRLFNSTLININRPTKGIVIHDTLPEWRNQLWVQESLLSTTTLHIGLVGFPNPDHIIARYPNCPKIASILQ